MNNWNFTGNIGKDAEQRFLPDGTSIVSFSVAVKSGFGEKAKTTWARCGMFGKRGESVLQFLKKGQLVGITGEATLDEYEDKDGIKHAQMKVRVNDLTLLGKKDSNEGSSPQQRQHAPAQQQTPQRNAQGGFPDSFDDDIPFAYINRKLAMCI